MPSLKADDHLAAPVTCPFCQSRKITTTAKRVTASTYWRCQACGQIWNVARLQPARQPSAPWRY